MAWKVLPKISCKVNNYHYFRHKCCNLYSLFQPLPQSIPIQDNRFGTLTPGIIKLPKNRDSVITEVSETNSSAVVVESPISQMQHSPNPEEDNPNPVHRTTVVNYPQFSADDTQPPHHTTVVNFPQFSETSDDYEQQMGNFPRSDDFSFVNMRPGTESGEGRPVDTNVRQDSGDSRDSGGRRIDVMQLQLQGMAESVID